MLALLVAGAEGNYPSTHQSEIISKKRREIIEKGLDTNGTNTINRYNIWLAGRRFL
jgi:hypothetical protein